MLFQDSTITDIFTLAAKEQEIALVFAAYAEELLEYHRFALRTFENILPEIRRDIGRCYRNNLSVSGERRLHTR